MASCTFRCTPRRPRLARGQAAPAEINRPRRLPGTVVRITLLPSLGGLSLFGMALLGLPLNAYHLSQVQALNRELGKLCARPPVEAQAVCRLHARLVSSL